MATSEFPSPDTLRQLIKYEPETGRFFWRERGAPWFSDDARRSSAWNARCAGREFGRRNSSVRYLATTILWRSILLHRVAWAISHGAWPVVQIDHVNGDRQDNRLANLREASMEENSRNRQSRRRSSSQYKGVYYCSRDGTWIAQIKVGGKGHHLGSFSDEASAARAYDAAAIRHYGDFARPNFPVHTVC